MDADYRLAFDLAPQPTWVVEAETLLILEANVAAVERYGFSREEFLRMRLVDLGAAEVGGAEGGPGRAETAAARHRARGGELIDVEVASRPVRWAGRAARIVVANDVTGRRRTEAALLESERRYGELLETVALAAVCLDPRGRVVSCNRHFVALTGWRREELVGEDWFLRCVPDDGDAFREGPGAAPVATRFECDVATRDGGRRRFRWTGTALRDPAGAPAGTTWVGEDVTERERAGEELRASEERYRRLFENNLAGVFRSSADGEILECNEAFVRIYGYDSAEEMRRTPASALYHSPGEREEYLRGLGEHGAMVSAESLGRRKDGSPVWLLENTHLVVEPGGMLVLEGTIVDITDMKLAEEAGRERAAKVRRHQEALFELAKNDARLSGDLDTVIATVSRVAAEVLEVASTSVWFLTDERDAVVCAGSYEPGGGPGFAGHRLEAASFPGYFRAIEQDRALAADDALSDPRTCELREIYLEPFGVGAMLDAPIRLRGVTVGMVCNDHAGGPRAWTVEEYNFASSIADLLSLAVEEADRRRLEGELRQAQKMEAVGRLAGGIAHDFNNLLTVILGRADLLAAKIDPQSALVRDVELIREVGKRAASLTGQLLAFSRKQVTAPRAVDVGALLRETESMLNRLIGEDVRLQLSLPEGPLRVKADPVQVEQVLLNLVINARDAMPSGGTVEISASEVDVADGRHRRAGTLRAGRYLALAVRDEGVGMDPATVARAFEPFFTTKEVGRGTGMGLSTVYGIAKQNGGHAEAESEPGRGSTFRVYLPLAPDGPAEAAGAAEPDPQPRGAGTVLLVEDEDAIRELLRELLEQWGFVVLRASHGAEALEVAAAHAGPIDLVLSDVVMPRMGGPEMVARLEASRPGVPVLFMSGYTNDRVLRQGVLEGDTPFLQKPFTSDALRLKIREVMGE